MNRILNNFLLFPLCFAFPISLIVNVLKWKGLETPFQLGYERCFLLSTLMLGIITLTERKEVKDHVQIDTTKPRILLLINSLIVSYFIWMERLQYFQDFGLNHKIFFIELISSPPRMLYLFDLIFLILSTTLFIYFKNQRKESWITFPILYFIFGNFTSVFCYYYIIDEKIVSQKRGERKYSLSIMFLVLASIFGIFCGYLMKHYIYDTPLKEAFQFDLSAHMFETVSSSILCLDLYFLGSVSIIFNVVEQGRLGNWSMVIWGVIYTELGILLGICIFSTVYTGHIYYLYQKYKENQKSTVWDQLLFALINLVMVVVVLIIAIKTPLEYLVFRELFV